MEVGFPNWIRVVCEDFEKQRAFYGEVLGLREVERSEDWAQYDMGPDVTFELLRRSDDPEYNGRRYQVGFVVDDIQAARDELLARGAEALTDVKEALDDSASWAYFRDPEGNVFEITQRANRTTPRPHGPERNPYPDSPSEPTR
jgi:catechol 2,3-dioxygenase-like lactoylglutathione lyase family enzyme